MSDNCMTIMEFLLILLMNIHKKHILYFLKHKLRIIIFTVLFNMKCVFICS